MGFSRCIVWFNKITLLHQVGTSLYFMRKMHGQTTLFFKYPPSLVHNEPFFAGEAGDSPS